MAFIRFTLADFEEMIKREVSRKYPYLFESKDWEWEDMMVSDKIHNTHKMQDTDVAMELVFTKHDQPLHAVVDKRPDVVYVDVHEVCR